MLLDMILVFLLNFLMNLSPHTVFWYLISDVCMYTKYLLFNKLWALQHPIPSLQIVIAIK